MGYINLAIFVLFATNGVIYVSSCENLPSPENLLFSFLCAVTRDLLAIAKFLVRNAALLRPFSRLH